MNQPLCRTLSVLLIAIGATQSGIRTSAQAPRTGTNPPAMFTDPDRPARLATAFPAIDRLVTDFMALRHVPGAAWGIVIDGKLAHLGVSGFRELAARAPVDKNTVFRIASMTKSFTAMAILKLRDEGKLSLDVAAERYVQS